MNRPLAVALLACLSLTGCAAKPSTPDLRIPETIRPSVVNLGNVGTPATVTQGAASATVVINKVTYAPSPDGMPPIAVLNVSITGLTAAPYAYSDQQFAEVPGGKSEWTPSPTENYSKFEPPAPLRSGTVSEGKSASGILILRGPTGDGSTTVVFRTDEPSQDFTHTITWLL